MIYALCIFVGMHFDADNLLSRQKGIVNGQKTFDCQSHCAIDTSHQPDLGNGDNIG